jgi:allene oxide cyclase-like protein
MSARKLTVIAALLAASPAAPGTATAAAPHSLRLVAQHQVPGTTDVDIDNGTPGAHDVGDGWAETDLLTRPRDGQQIGRAALSCTILIVDQGEPSLEQCVGAAELQGGSLMFYGLLHGPRSTLAVIGGTGRYRHAHGTLTLLPLDEHRSRWTFALAP